MRSQPLPRRRVAAGLVASTLVFAACGASDDGAGDAGDAGDVAASADAATDTADTAATGAAPTGVAAVDLVGAELLPASDVESNPLPDVIVDDINTGRKVNFRNLAPQDKPILLWMWAPH